MRARQIKRLAGRLTAAPAVQLPSFAKPGDACFDLRAVVVDGNLPRFGFIQPGGFRILRTGLHVEVPPGYAMQIFSRSGHGFKDGVRLRNGTGIIDSGYRGELQVALVNDGERAFRYEHGDRIAQAWIVPVPALEFELVDELSATERGEGGFGSSGVK